MLIPALSVVQDGSTMEARCALRWLACNLSELKSSPHGVNVENDCCKEASASYRRPVELKLLKEAKSFAACLQGVSARRVAHAEPGPTPRSCLFECPLPWLMEGCL